MPRARPPASAPHALVLALALMAAAPAVQADSPALRRLEVTKVEKTTILLNFIGQNVAGDRFKFSYEDTKRRKLASKFIRVGDRFFHAPPTKDRFRLKGGDIRQIINLRTNTASWEHVALVEDLSPHKKGRTYEVQKGSGQRGVLIRDWEILLSYPRHDRGEHLYRLKENESFTLPGDRVAGRRFTFKEIDDAGNVVIEYEKAGKLCRFMMEPPADD